MERIFFNRINGQQMQSSRALAALKVIDCRMILGDLTSEARKKDIAAG